MTAEVLIVRIEPTADASFAAMRARNKFGIAMAAMIKIIATTISNSISEKPFCFLFTFFPLNRALKFSFTPRPSPFRRAATRYTLRIDIIQLIMPVVEFTPAGSWRRTVKQWRWVSL